MKVTLRNFRYYSLEIHKTKLLDEKASAEIFAAQKYTLRRGGKGRLKIRKISLKIVVKQAIHRIRQDGHIFEVNVATASAN